MASCSVEVDQKNELMMLSEEVDKIQFKEAKNGLIVKAFIHKKVA